MDKTPVAKSKLPKFHNNVERADPSLQISQDSVESMEVGWDWNSPQAQPKRKSRKHLIPPQSPKIPLKRHTSKESFERIKEELRALKQEMAMPENEDCLQLSPLEEEDFKNCNDFLMEDINFLPEDAFDDFFDSNLDEKLVECSTQIEKKLSPKNVIKPDEKENNIKGSDNLENLIRKLNNPERKPEHSRRFKFLSPTQGKVEFCRTQSYEESTTVFNKNTLDEIERKRLEAIAKLESKKKTNSPASVTAEEIERKRREALAKIEAKRQEEIIERKRLEALKKLESRRMKNAQYVKSTLVDRY